MVSRKTTVFENGLIWFGAGISLAEILTGTYFAPLGFSKGMAAIITGHIIGCVLLFLAGLIGAKSRKSSMETVGMSFGRKGSIFFAFLNVIQLVGWTAIMIYDGAAAADAVFAAGHWVWSLGIGVLIGLWIVVGVRSLGKLNTVAIAGLFILTVILSFVIFSKSNGANIYAAGDTMSFGAAVELSVAMPLSWLPLISDYTRDAAKPVKATAASAITYGLVSCWMYAIGMGAAIFAGTSDVAQIMLTAGLGTAGLLIIVFSTVTTTFLDAYSAGVSGEALFAKLNGKWLGLAALVIGTLCAVIYPITNITDFLYLIGSVFAPMIAIQIADYFVLKKSCDDRSINTINICIWFLGFIIYRAMMRLDIIVGSTLPSMLITCLICMVADWAVSKVKSL